MTDIIELIMSGHERMLRLQTALHDVARYHRDAGSGWALASVWDRLATLIDLHTQAEEEICYPAMFGTSRAGLAQVQASIADHDIREALGEARLQPVDSDRWWTAVKAALSTWVEQIDREERGMLADFARRADRAQRDKLGRQWSAFITARHGDLMPATQPGGAVCQLCQSPISGSHCHVIDAELCAILCTCPACYVLSRHARDGQNHPGRHRPGGMCDTPATPTASPTSRPEPADLA